MFRFVTIETWGGTDLPRESKLISTCGAGAWIETRGPLGQRLNELGKMANGLLQVIPLGLAAFELVEPMPRPWATDDYPGGDAAESCSE